MIHTRTQRLMQAAYDRVKARTTALQEARNFTKGYASFAKSFPALIHGVGLCQAVAFAEAKAENESGSPSNDSARVLHDLADMLGLENGASLTTNARDYSAEKYWRLSQFALQAASLLKRYAETFEKDFPSQSSPSEPAPAGAVS